MTTIKEVLAAARPASVAQARANWPIRDSYHPSPEDWRDECLYFFLPDRFSDEIPPGRPLLDRSQLGDARGGAPQWSPQAWDGWAYSGRARFQGGTLRGAAQRLDYLADLGVTAVWVGPVWKQRRESFVNNAAESADEYHGYAIQDFFDVDPRFGGRDDLVALVQAAHDRQIRVVFDVILNHTARNWLYAANGQPLPLNQDPMFDENHTTVYDFDGWLDGDGNVLPSGAAPGPDDAVWPSDLQDAGVYHRRGQIAHWNDRDAAGNPDLSADAEIRLADMTNRDLALEAAGTGGREQPLQVMIACWTYWMALTDCDGFRIDTLKHVSVDEARTFCGAVKEYAETLGKRNFLLAGEMAGGDAWEQTYLDALASNLSAALDIGEHRGQLRSAALGADAQPFIDRYNSETSQPLPGSHRAAGSYFVTSVDDHDDVSLAALQRFPSLNPVQGQPGEGDVANFYHPLQTITGSALLLFTLGIPCLYYGAEQGLAAPAVDPLQSLPHWGDSNQGWDRYLREAMFGPEHPRQLGGAGRPAVPGGATPDPAVPGFGPFGSTGHHVFDPASPTFRRIRALLAARRSHPPLRVGRQYWRPATAPGQHPDTGARVPGVMAWSRILARQEIVVIVNTTPPASNPGAPGQPGQPSAAADAQVLVEASFNPAGSRFEVVASTAQCAGLAAGLDAGATLGVQVWPGGAAYLSVTGLPGHEVLVLARDAQAG